MHRSKELSGGLCFIFFLALPSACTPELYSPVCPCLPSPHESTFAEKLNLCWWIEVLLSLTPRLLFIRDFLDLKSWSLLILLTPYLRLLSYQTMSNLNYKMNYQTKILTLVVQRYTCWQLLGAEF